MCIQTDRTIAKLIHAAEVQVGGPQNLLVVFTADHGVAPVPEVNVQRKLPGTRIHSDTLLQPIRERLREKFGEGDWILSDLGESCILTTRSLQKRGFPNWTWKK
jgi:Type I phosphodiesterase / nucleotide pyrophosphatase